MKKHQYEITINAPREKVWKSLWEDKTYREWTEVFSPGSYAKTDWKKGSKVYFLNEEDSGMVAEIADNREPEYLSIRHLGMLNKGVEDFDSDLVKQWAGAEENYTLAGNNGQTHVRVDIDIAEEYAKQFDEMWPKALEKLKEIAER